jgi:DsbC/DsbD-like thiol-disulfide interchange protein
LYVSSNQRMRGPCHQPCNILWSIVILCFVASVTDQSISQASPSSHAHLQLVAERTDFEPGRTIWVGVLFHMDPAWHIYWQNPGDSGTPPVIQWVLPVGFHVGSLLWPVPERLGSGSVIDYGYTNQVLLMTPVTASANAKGAGAIVANVKYVVCSEVCVPGKTQLSLSIPPEAGRAHYFSASRILFQRTRSKVPQPPPISWKISARAGKDQFELAVRGVAPKQGIIFFPLDPDVIDNAAPQVTTPASGGFDVTLRASELITRTPTVLKGVLTVPGIGSYDISAPVAVKRQ